MTKGKRIAVTVSAMALSAAMAIGGTLAYLNSVTETKTNTFSTSKNIVTELTETEWNEDSGSDYYPGKVIAKNPVMKNDSTEPVWMAIKVSYIDNDSNAVSYDTFKKYAAVSTNETDADNDGINDNWVKIHQSDDYEAWMYKGTVAANSSTGSLFDNVTVSAGIKKIWNVSESTTTVKKYVNGELVNVDVTKSEPESEVTYYDEEGNVIKDAAKLPSFEIKVKGFAVQSTDVNQDTAKTELLTLIANTVTE